MSSNWIAGDAAGVPFVALPPATEAATAPIVLAWHLLDAPRTEAAFAAAIPLDGLDAWRFYLGLPLTGSRLPEGGWEALMQLGFEDAVLKLYEPMTVAAAEEAVPALTALRERFGLEGGPVGLMGGSAGAAVVQLLLVEGALDAAGAVLISPVVQLRRVIEAGERQLGFEYSWSDEAEAFADRLDFVARAPEIARRSTAVLLVTGAEDDPGIREPAAQLHAALAESGTAEHVIVPGMAHALADEPGVEPAPQTAHAAAVDRAAAEWFARRF